MAWMTVAEVKALQRLTGTANDAQIAALLVAVEAWLEGIRPIAPRELTERYDGTDSGEIVLRHRPVVEDEDVIVEYDRARVFDGDPIGTELYSVDYSAGIISLDEGDGWSAWGRGGDLGSAWLEGKGTIRVTATYGYATVPADLKLLLSEIVAPKVLDTGNEGVKSETIGSYSYTLADFDAAGGVGALTPLSRSLWDRYFAGVGTDTAR